MEELSRETGFSAKQLQRLMRMRSTSELLASARCTSESHSQTVEVRSVRMMLFSLVSKRHAVAVFYAMTRAALADF